MNSRLCKHTSRIAGVVALLLLLVASLWLYGQPGRPAAVGQINPQVNRQVGPVYAPSSIKYYAADTSRPLPSEYRNACFRSGALPSEIAMGYAKMGPITPGGPLAYLPAPAPQPWPPPAPQGAAAFSTGSVRYATPNWTNTAWTAPTAVASRPPAPAPATIQRPPSAFTQTSGTVYQGSLSQGPLIPNSMSYGSINYAR